MFNEERTAQQEGEAQMPNIPYPQGERRRWQGPVLGAGADYRAPLWPTLGGEQQEGRTEKPAALAAWRRDLCGLGVLSSRCACIYSWAVCLWKRLLSCQIVNYLGSS